MSQTDIQLAQADIQLAQDVAAMSETKAFKDLITKVQGYYDPARQHETIHDALRVILVTMNALGPKTVTALKEAQSALKTAESAAT